MSQNNYKPNFDTFPLTYFECYEQDDDRNSLIDAVRKSHIINSWSLPVSDAISSQNVRRMCGIKHDVGILFAEIPLLENFFWCNINIYSFQKELSRKGSKYINNCDILLYEHYFLIKSINEKKQVNIFVNECEYSGCKTRPSFAFINERPRFCATHRLNGMINTKSLKCKECNLQATCGPIDGYEEYCRWHMKEGMVWLDIYELGQYWKSIADRRRNLIKSLENEEGCSRYLQTNDSNSDFDNILRLCSLYRQQDEDLKSYHHRILCDKVLKRQVIDNLRKELDKFRCLIFGPYHIYKTFIDEKLSVNQLLFIVDMTGLCRGDIVKWNLINRIEWAIEPTSNIVYRISSYRPIPKISYQEPKPIPKIISPIHPVSPRKGSFGEKSCAEVLEKKCISYKREYTISSLPGRRYDFYFIYNGVNYLFEFDGKQHFHLVTFFHKNEEIFKEKQEVDVVKTREALKSGYRVIRIDYTQEGKIDDHLSIAFESKEKLYLSSSGLYRYIIENLSYV